MGYHGMTVVSTTVRARHHGQIVVASIAVPFSFIKRYVLYFALDRGIWHGLVIIRYFGPLLVSSLIIKASEIKFSFSKFSKQDCDLG